MKQYIFSLVAAVCLLSYSAQAQQEIQYSQNILNSHLLINPAYSGFWEETTIGVKYRNQWVSAPGAPESVMVLGETNIKNNFSLGFMFNNDQIGITSTNTVEVDPAVKIQVSEQSHLSFGAKLGFSRQRSDFSMLQNVNLADPLYSRNTISAPYVGLGILYANAKYYVGLSSPRMLNFEDNSNSTKLLASHIYLYGGSRFTLQEGLELRPQLLFKHDLTAPLIAEISSTIWFQNIVGFGAGYRSGDAVSVMLQCTVNSIHFGYSYDMTTSALQQTNRGTHELYIGLAILKKAPKEDEEETLNRSANPRYF